MGIVQVSVELWLNEVCDRMTVTLLHVETTMSSQHKVNNEKKNKYAIQPTQFRGQVSSTTPELGAVSLPLVPN